MLCRMNTKDSIADKFVMFNQRTCCNRASDTGNSLWEDMKVDYYQPLPRIVMQDWQVKVKDQKPVPVLPSNDDPSLSFALALGDYLSVGGANEKCAANTPTKHYLMPSFAGKKGASKDITVRGKLYLCCT